MALNPNIALQTQGIQLPDFAGAYQGILNNRARREDTEQRRELHRAQMLEIQRKTAAEDAAAQRSVKVREIVKGGGTAKDVMGEDIEAGLKLADEERKTKLFDLESTTKTLTNQKTEMEMALKNMEVLGQAANASTDEATFFSNVGNLLASGAVKREQLAPYLAEYNEKGWTPEFQQKLKAMGQQAMSVKDQGAAKLQELQMKIQLAEEERKKLAFPLQQQDLQNKVATGTPDPVTKLTPAQSAEFDFKKQTQEALETYRANSLRISQQNANRIASNQGRVAGQQQTTNEAKLRDDFSAAAKPFKSVSEAYSRVMAAEGDKGVNDIALIYGYMKMLDPGSVVREGEFATAANAAGIPDRISTLYNNAIKGAKLSPQIRQEMKEQAKEVYKAAEADFASVEGEYKGIAERSGVDPRNVIINFRSKKDAAGKSQPPKIEILSVK